MHDFERRQSVITELVTEIGNKSFTSQRWSGMTSQPPGTNVAVVAGNKSAHAMAGKTSLVFLR